MPTKRTKKKTGKPEAAAPSLSLAVQYAVGGARAPAGLPTRAQFRRWARAALAEDAAVTLRLVNEAEGRRLNAAFRGQRNATNVLSFGYDGMRPLSGDLVLCAPVIRREAREQGKTLAAHCAHLTVHGMLHLQGYDHQRDSDARTMERLETVILARLGYPDPYRPHAAGGRDQA